MTNEKLIVGKHYPSIDGLRGVAVLLVLWFHASWFILINVDQLSMTGLIYGYSLLTIIGMTGVDLFFVLSGFLITGILIDTCEEQDALKKFYIRRSLRILPLYYAVFFAFLIYFLLIFNLNGLDTSKIFSHLFYVQNWSSGYNADPFILLEHTWTLAVEEQFYLFWPMVFLLFYKNGSNLKHTVYLCLFMIVLSWAFRLLFMDLNQHKAALTFTITRLDGFSFGALLSIACVHHQNTLLKYKYLIPITFIISLILLMVTLFSNDIHKGMPREMISFGLMICTILYTAILAHIILSDDTAFTKRLLNTNWLRCIGKYSYGIYLFHSPVMMIMAQKLYNHNLGYWKEHLILISCGTTISFIMAFISYHLLEKRMLLLKNKYAPQ